MIVETNKHHPFPCRFVWSVWSPLGKSHLCYKLRATSQLFLGEIHAFALTNQAVKTTKTSPTDQPWTLDQDCWFSWGAPPMHCAVMSQWMDGSRRIYIEMIIFNHILSPYSPAKSGTTCSCSSSSSKSILLVPCHFWGRYGLDIWNA